METQNSTEVVIIQYPELDKVVNVTGIEEADQALIKTSYIPYFEEMAKIKEESKKINFENPTELDEKIARELRLRTVKVRTGSEEVKDNRKRIHSLKANVEQDAWNLIKSTCKVEEEIFLQVEKATEIANKARIEALKLSRVDQIKQYGE